MLNLSEEGHMFDHEPGHTDYHFDRHREHEDERHSEYYETARYPVFLDTATDNQMRPGPDGAYDHGRRRQSQYHESYNNAPEANLYHSYPVYSPLVPHEW